MSFTFDAEQQCPECHSKFTHAERRRNYEPVLVVSCPKCQTLLWRPGSDETSPLYIFNPAIDSDSI